MSDLKNLFLDVKVTFKVDETIKVCYQHPKHNSL